MPVYPVQWLPAVKTGHYPHMAKHDAKIWERFLDLYASELHGVAYDVALGGFVLADDVASEPERQGWRYSTALKVDAVADVGDHVWIIEVKPTAGVSAIGAALCYVVMAEADGFTDKELVAAVVTDRATEDIKHCAVELGVVVMEMGGIA
jgi:hypothetical protein